jgi:hypothetical protein
MVGGWILAGGSLAALRSAATEIFLPEVFPGWAGQEFELKFF